MASSDIPAIVAKVRATSDSGKAHSIQWRKNQIQQIVKMFTEKASEWDVALEKDLGHKSEFFTRGIEIQTILAEAKFILKNLDKWAQPEAVSSPLVVQPASSYIVHEPLGLLLLISPWNYPVSLIFQPLMGAIAAGNCVVIKPSEISEAVSQLTAKLVPQYLDNDAIVVVEGGIDESTQLLKQKWDHIFYTGNGLVAKVIMKAAAENLTPVTLELGGKSPCIVDSSVDLTVATRRILWAKFTNCGQTCVAPDYILACKDVEPKLVESLKKNLLEFYGENPQKSKDYSRIINQRHTNRLTSLLERSKKEGVEIVTGGTSDVADRYLAPTIVRNVKKGSALLEDEIFGPILPIVTVDSIEDAVKAINSRDKPLALYIFSSNKKTQDYVIDHTSSGGCCVNEAMVQVGNNDLPFGGVGSSGIGSYHGYHSFKTLSHEKGVLKRPFILDAPLRYPPYTESKLKQLRFLRAIDFSPSQLAFGFGAAGVAALAVFLGSSEFGHEFVIGPLRQYLLEALRAAIRLLE